MREIKSLPISTETGFSKQPQRILGPAGWQEVYELKYKVIPSLK